MLLNLFSLVSWLLLFLTLAVGPRDPPTPGDALGRLVGCGTPVGVKYDVALDPEPVPAGED